MNKKNRNRFKRMPLICKYRWRGMAKTNLRKLTKTAKDDTEFSKEMEMWEQASIQDFLAFEKGM